MVRRISIARGGGGSTLKSALLPFKGNLGQLRSFVAQSKSGLGSQKTTSPFSKNKKGKESPGKEPSPPINVIGNIGLLNVLKTKGGGEDSAITPTRRKVSTQALPKGKGKPLTSGDELLDMSLGKTQTNIRIKKFRRHF